MTTPHPSAKERAAARTKAVERKKRVSEKRADMAAAAGLLLPLPASQDAILGPLPPKSGPGRNRTLVRGKAVNAGKPKKKKSKSLSKLKKELWDLISLVVRSWSAVCVACLKNPTYSANHIVPAGDGSATKWFLPNLYPGCGSCNEAERRRRGQWVKKHEEMFGADFVDALYAFSRTTFQPKKWWVLEQTDRMRRLLAMRENLKAGLGETA